MAIYSRKQTIQRCGNSNRRIFHSTSVGRIIRDWGTGSRIGVLGGGLAGLASAYYLSSLLPTSNKIIVWEKHNRFGGWIRSSHIKDPTLDADFILEAGPRSVRPKGLAGLISLQLIKDLKLLDSVIVIPKDHSSARNRYIYTKHGLQKLPSSIWTLVNSIHKRPVSLIPKSILRDVLNTGERSRKLIIDDESVQEFISRRFGDQIGEELISGMVHGIYAGDYRELSVKSSIFKPIWELERKVGGVINGLVTRRKQPQSTTSRQEQDLLHMLHNDPKLVDLINSSVWGLKGGLETLIDSLRNWLEKQPNVILKPAETIKTIELSPDGHSSVTTSHGVYNQLDHLISALPPKVLYSCLTPSLQNRLSILNTNPSVTVGVVNLVYRSTRRINPIPPAFGYLIPASIGPDLNPHRVLGVVFDSDMMPGVEDKVEGLELTKLTVMMGGHYYSKWPELIPSDNELIDQASQTIRNQLGIDEDPFFVKAQLQKDCIPQYLVGHHQRMLQLHHQLNNFNLSLVGSGYSGVGLNDVIKASKENVNSLIKYGTATGLENFET